MPENIFSLSFGFILSKVPGDHVSARVGKLYVRDTRDDLGEERSVGWILRFLKHLGVAITESRLKQELVRCLLRQALSQPQYLSHVAQSDGSLAGAVHK